MGRVGLGPFAGGSGGSGQLKVIHVQLYNNARI